MKPIESHKFWFGSVNLREKVDWPQSRSHNVGKFGQLENKEMYLSKENTEVANTFSVVTRRCKHKVQIILCHLQVRSSY